MPKYTNRLKHKSHYENVPFEVPEGWCWRTLGDIGTWQAGGTPSRMHKEYYGGNIPWLKTGDLNDGIITSIPENITEEGLNNSSAKLNPTGSVLIAMYGATTGKIGILGMPATTNQACCACINYEGVIQKYLFYFLLSHKKEFIALGGGGAQPNISKDIIVKTLIPIPPIKEQERIVSQIDNLLNLLETLDTNKYSLETSISQAKSKILDLAIHGKLVPQDANDEPASELLKRINPKAVASCDNTHYGNVPDGWIMLKGKYLFDSMKSTKPAGEFFKYIDSDSIDNKRGIVTSPKVLSSNSAPSRASRYTCQGDVLFSMVRPYLRNIAIVPENDCIASTGFFVCHPIPVMTAEFCYFLMKSSYIVDGLNQFMKGDNSPSINNANITDWIYPIPPLEEQNRIVKKIKKLYGTIDCIAEALL